MSDDEVQGETADRDQPASLQDLVQGAKELRALIADEEWVFTEESRENVLMRMSAFMTGIGNMAEPKETEYTLEYRLARVEAHRVYGSCALFGRVTERVAGFLKDGPLDEANANEADNAATDLYIALGQFIAMAERL